MMRLFSIRRLKMNAVNLRKVAVYLMRGVMWGNSSPKFRCKVIPMAFFGKANKIELSVKRIVRRT